MNKWSVIITFVLTIYLSYKLSQIVQPPSLPKLEETWWGPEGKEDKSIRPFTINISHKILDDLRYRLEHHRQFIPPLQGIQQQYGMNTNLLNEIVEFWKTKYNWREREKFLNKFSQFTTNIQGLKIHYLHIKPKNVGNDIKILPLLLLHGWPGSVREFYELIPILTTQQKGYDFVFEVIVPSLPGYGFSAGATKPGLGAAQMALVFKNFMKHLGFDKFYCQGGDFGGIILQHLVTLYPEVVYGYHSNMCIVNTPLAMFRLILGSLYPQALVKEDHISRIYPLKESFSWYLLESGYLHIQSTKPDTIGVGLDDSPVGLAAYILEKFVTGTNRNYNQREDGGLREKFSYTDLLDNIMIYWVTNSMTTAVRLYSNTFNKDHMSLGVIRNPIQVPTACVRFRYDFYVADGVMDEIFPKLLQLTDYDGGHFAALEVPEIFANDIISAVDKFEKYHRTK